ncbi:MAG: superoxide dismutase [Bacteroidota bacterium]
MKQLTQKFSVVVIGLLFASFSFAQTEQKKPSRANASSLQTVPVTVESGKQGTNVNKDIMPVGGGLADNWSIPSGQMVFYSLPYEYGALEPVIDKMTVELHYDKHHRTYFSNFQKAISETELAKLPIYTIFEKIALFSDGVRNNAGGYFNHVLYWENISPKGGGKPAGSLGKIIEKQFGSFDDFIKKFNQAAISRFGSGWAWLSVDYVTGELFISTTANQDNPMMGTNERMGVPILALDVWEHAYYLNYQNRRSEYIDAFWNIVDWKVVERRYELAQLKKEDRRKTK